MACWPDGVCACTRPLGAVADEAIERLASLKHMLTYERFCTGSRVYGTTREDSDLDVVCLCSGREFLKLWRSSDTLKEEFENNGISESTEYPPEDQSLRFGKLNLLCFESSLKFAAWKEGTRNLIARRPVTRDEAIEELDRCYTEHRNDRNMQIEFTHYADRAFRELADVFANL